MVTVAEGRGGREEVVGPGAGRARERGLEYWEGGRTQREKSTSRF